MSCSCCEASALPRFDAAISSTRACSQFWGTPRPHAYRSARSIAALIFPFFSEAHSHFTATAVSACPPSPPRYCNPVLSSASPGPVPEDHLRASSRPETTGRARRFFDGGNNRGLIAFAVGEVCASDCESQRQLDKTLPSACVSPPVRQ